MPWLQYGIHQAPWRRACTPTLAPNAPFGFVSAWQLNTIWWWWWCITANRHEHSNKATKVRDRLACKDLSATNAASSTCHEYLRSKHTQKTCCTQHCTHWLYGPCVLYVVTVRGDCTYWLYTLLLAKTIVLLANFNDLLANFSFFATKSLYTQDVQSVCTLSMYSVQSVCTLCIHSQVQLLLAVAIVFISLSQLLFLSHWASCWLTQIVSSQ